ISGIHLDQAGKCKEARERIVCLEVAHQNGEVASGKRQAKAVPLLSKREGQAFAGSVGATDTDFVKASVVVASKSLEEVEDETAGLGCSVGELMPSPVVFANGNEDVLVDVEWFGEALGEDINDVVVAVGAIVELYAKGILPLLCLQHVGGIGRMEQES